MKIFLLAFLLNHLNYQEIVFLDKGELIEEINEKDFRQYYAEIESKFYGWNSKLIYDEVDIVFVSKTLFSYKNQSTETITYQYNYESGKSVKDSMSFSGDLSAEVDLKYKKNNLNLGAEFKKKYDEQNTTKINEKWKLDIKVAPYTKMSLKIKGEGKLSSGVSKFYYFFIPLKKGGWEMIDISSEYYWLSEEYV